MGDMGTSTRTATPVPPLPQTGAVLQILAPAFFFFPLSLQIHQEKKIIKYSTRNKTLKIKTSLAEAQA